MAMPWFIDCMNVYWQHIMSFLTFECDIETYIVIRHSWLIMNRVKSKERHFQVHIRDFAGVSFWQITNKQKQSCPSCVVLMLDTRWLSSNKVRVRHFWRQKLKMAESLRRLVNIQTFTSLQDRLEKWLDDYHVSLLYIFQTCMHTFMTITNMYQKLS